MLTVATLPRPARAELFPRAVFQSPGPKLPERTTIWIRERAGNSNISARIPVSRRAKRRRLPRKHRYAVPVARAERIGRRDPRAADADDVGEREVLAALLGADAAGRTEADVGQRRRQRLEIGERRRPARPGRISGRRSRASASVIASPAVATPGQEGNRTVLGRRDQAGRGARADQELRAAGRRPPSSWRGVEHRSRADIGALDLGRDRPDAVEPGRRCGASPRAPSARRRPARGRAAPPRRRSSMVSTGTTGRRLEDRGRVSLRASSMVGSVRLGLTRRLAPFTQAGSRDKADSAGCLSHPPIAHIASPIGFRSLGASRCRDYSARTALAPAMLSERAGRTLQEVLLVLVGTAILAISAKVKVPFYPVPMTLQTLAVMLIAATYGMRLGGHHDARLSRRRRPRPARLRQHAADGREPRPISSARRAASSSPIRSPP